MNYFLKLELGLHKVDLNLQAVSYNDPCTVWAFHY